MIQSWQGLDPELQRLSSSDEAQPTRTGRPVTMLLPRFVRCSQQALDFSKHSFISWKKSYSTALKSSEPLRILFCGSDEFSCASLDALHQEHGRNPELIQSIDVVVRPSKPTGRGHKILRESN